METRRQLLGTRGDAGRLGLVATLAFGLLSVGCSRKEARIEAEPAATASSTDSVAPAPHCPNGLPGPELVLVVGAGGVPYCIDARETTRAEYDLFLEKKAGDTSGQPAECAWNDAYVPVLWTPGVDEPPEDSVYACKVDDWERPGDEPVGCVDFCDALAYCASAGKRLCGRVGDPGEWGRVYVGWDGNTQPQAEREAFVVLIDSTESELFNACSEGGQTRYPYGDAFEPARCKDAAWVAGGGALAVEATTENACRGDVPPFDRIYDLGGSVEEWQNFCTVYPSVNAPSCAVLAASYYEVQPNCAGYGLSAGRSVVPGRGFRCCADAVQAL